jgi:protein-L-isoaspartate(D-aspartate) O-methyltransferase
MSDFIEQKKRLLEQIDSQLHLAANIKKAFLSVPREIFVLEKYKDAAYADTALPLLKGQTISQPYTVLAMLQALNPKPRSKVLEIGAGSGYNAALLGKLCKEVHTIEIVPELCDYAKARIESLGLKNVYLHYGDGSLGFPKEAPYDRIIATASAKEMPKAWREQLKRGGILVYPEGEVYSSVLKKCTKLKNNSLKCENLGFYAFVPLK